MAHKRKTHAINRFAAVWTCSRYASSAKITIYWCVVAVLSPSSSHYPFISCDRILFIYFMHVHRLLLDFCFCSVHFMIGTHANGPITITWCARAHAHNGIPYSAFWLCKSPYRNANGSFLMGKQCHSKIMSERRFYWDNAATECIGEWKPFLHRCNQRTQKLIT